MRCNHSSTRNQPSRVFASKCFDLEVYDVKHLNVIIAQLRAKKVVAKVDRVTE